MIRSIVMGTDVETGERSKVIATSHWKDNELSALSHLSDVIVRAIPGVGSVNLWACDGVNSPSHTLLASFHN
jgi:hypothetical protein